jgi:hypothetical protein
MPHLLTLTLGFVVAATLAMPVPAKAQVLKKEPGPGQLAAGQTVLVDDGSCPKGKIKQITGGSNITGGQGVKGGSRTKKCVNR